VIGIFVPEIDPTLSWWPPVVVVVALVLFNIVNHRVAPRSHGLLWSFGGSVLLIALGLLDGNTWTDMGLGWARMLPGLVWAGAAVGLVTVFYLVGAWLPRTREAFRDERNASLTGPLVAFRALIEVPLGTVLLEEIAFRAVLFSMLARRYGLIWAVVISSLLFGLWHVLPSVGTHEQNPALSRVFGTGLRANIAVVTLSVITTALSGVVFAGLRILSGSVLAPMGLHWATNGLGYTFSWVILRWRRDHHRPPTDPG